MKRTQRADTPLAAKALKTVASSSVTVPNPLKDKALIQAAAIAAARELVAEGATFTGAQFSRRVIERMGYGREFAVNDQGTRTRLHSKDVKLAAFEAALATSGSLRGAGGEWLKTHEVKPGPAVAVVLPELPVGGRHRGSLVRPSSARCKRASPPRTRTHCGGAAGSIAGRGYT